jgi:pyruvate/2-oxoglutarate dehydrogenase complex dihydrolipoamide acyltransferase (E2) component
VKEGQQVSAGQTLGTVGATGNANNQNVHLHFEVRAANDPDYGLGSIDPEAWLSDTTRNSGTARPRGDTSAINSDHSPYTGTSNPRNAPVQIPRGATLLPGGRYYHNGRIHNPFRNDTATPTYNRANPVRNSVTPSTSNGFNAARDNRPLNNYGYDQLARNQPLARELNATATRLGFPAVWLADIIAFESGFDPSEDNGQGYSGLIQFGDAAAADMGTTRAELARMSPVQQMRYVEKYLAKFGPHRFQTPFHVLMAIWGGEGNLRRLERQGFRGVASISDGNITFERYSLRLGENAGRRYAVPGSDRRERVANHVHTSYTPGCSICNQMSSNNSRILPHEGQYASRLLPNQNSNEDTRFIG